MRCGFDVTIYEVSDRIGGRLFTGGNPGDSKKTGMVMAAMRMPFFSLPGNKNCILEHYVLDEADQNGSPALYETFPNPGTAPGVTGIYFNNGLRPESDFPQPEMIMQPDGLDAENKDIANLAAKAGRFIEFFEATVKSIYLKDDNQWEQMRSKIVEHYGTMTFYDLVLEPAMNVYAVDNGDLGGFGMTEEEANLLYTIGTGDYTWGLFTALVLYG